MQNCFSVYRFVTENVEDVSGKPLICSKDSAVALFLFQLFKEIEFIFVDRSVIF